MVDSVVLPALVAGVVALGIEYAAKPRLEIRKDRLLHRTHALRALAEALAGMLSMAATLRTAEVFTTAPTLLQSELNRLEVLIEQGRTSLVAAALRLPDEVRTAAAVMLGEVRGRLERARLGPGPTDPEGRDDLMALAGSIEKMSPLVDYLYLPFWRLILRAKALATLK